MADSKITALTSIGASTDPANDPLVLVDVSDTSMAATGTTKKVTLNQLLGAGGTATLASATITGALTVGTGANAAVQKGSILGGYTVFENSAGTGNPSITFNNDIDTGLLNPTANTIAFAIGGSEAMRLNSTGLGVGVTPGYPLHVQRANAGPTAWLANSTTYSQLKMVSSGTNQPVYVTLNPTGTGAAIFQISDVDRLTIDTSGNVGVGVTPSGTGGCLQLKSGITFPATQVASSDANTLDDYEEGTFTATLKGGTADPTTPVTTTGRYTKIGRLVSIQLLFNNVATTGASGSISVSGLPFSSASSIYNSGSAVSGDMATFTGTLGCWLPPSSSTIDVISSASNGSISSATHNAGTSRYLAININYTV
jgi:hypothetical protein